MPTKELSPTTTFDTALIPVDAIRMWDNARTQLDNGQLEELARSLQDTGAPLQLPVGFRVEDDASAEVLLVMGERRWRACRMLRDRGVEGFDRMPVRIIPRPSRNELYKWSLVENEQRVDLRPTEKGAWLARMLELTDEKTGMPVWTQASLAEEIGKDVPYVSYLMALLKAPASVRAAVDAGVCPMRVGAMVGSLPAAMREGAAAEMVGGPMGPMTERQAKAWVAERYRRDLRRAEFSTEASGLGEAPACVRCEWWGGNREDVGGKSAVHVCLNPECFSRKQRAALGSADEVGRVLEGAEAAGLWEAHSGRLAPGCGWVDVSDRPSPLLLVDGGSALAAAPMWRDLIEGAGLETVAAFDGAGQRRTLVETGQALRAAGRSRWGGLFKEGAVTGYLSPAEKGVERMAKAAGEREFRAAVSEGLAELVRGLEGSGDVEGVFSALARAAAEDLCKGDDLAMLAEVLGAAGREGRTAEGVAEALASRRGVGLAAGLAAVLLVRRVRYEGFAHLVQEEGAPLADLCRAAGFDAGGWNRKARRVRAAGEREARERAEAEAQEKAAREIERRGTRG